MIIYKLIGFDNYIIKDKIMYRKAHKVKDKLCKFKYISEREVKLIDTPSRLGYMLERGAHRKYYSLKKLSHRLKLVK